MLGLVCFSSNTLQRTRVVAFVCFALLACATASRSAVAASATWSGATDASWATTGNWNASPVPGSADTATFNATSSNTTINVGTGLSVGSIVFDTSSAAAYTIGSGGAGSQTLTLASGVTANAGVTTNQLFNANILLGTATAGTYTFTNNATGSLTFSGTVQGGTGGTAGAKTLNVSGSGATNFTNVVGAGGGTNLSLVNVGSGTMTLSGAVTSSLNTLRATASGWAIVDGQTVTVASASTYGGSSTTNGKFELRSGSVAFNGGINFNTSVPDGSLIRVTGGTFSTSSLTMLRTWGNSTAAATTAAATTSGFVVSGGTASVTGVLDLAGSNANASALVSGGSLSVGGELRIGNSTSATGRWFVFQVSDGTLTSTDATNGIVLARSTNGNANNGALLLTGGTTTAEKISFGVTTTASGAAGTVTLNGATAAIYLGSGGIVKSSASSYTSTITLTAGVLGAKADWSSALDMSLNGSGTAVTFQAADASGVAKNISLSGTLSGAGGFTKSGSGKLTLSGANAFTGAMALASGTLAVGNASALGAGTNALTVNGGTVDLGGYSVAVGTLSGGAGTISSSVAGASLSSSITTTSTFAGTIADGAGTVAVTKSGAAALTLTGVNTYTGNTTISSGTLEVGGSGQLGGGSYSGAISNAGGLVYSTSANQTLSGVISGVGSLVKSGAGVLTLSNTGNTASGATTLNAGTLAFAPNALGTGTVTLNGGVLQWAAGNTQDVSSLLKLVSGSATTLDTNGNDVTLANALAGGTIAAALTKAGAGKLTLAGANTFTGATTIASGILEVGGAGVLGSGSYAAAISNAGVLSVASSGTQTLSGAITGAGSLIKSGVGMLTLSNTSNAYSGGTTLNAGIISFATNALGTGTVTLGGGTLRWATGNTQDISAQVSLLASGTATLDTNGNDVTLANALGGGAIAAGLTKAGSGKLTLTGVNAYTGSTTISSGTLELGGAGQLGSGSYAGSIANAGTVVFSSSANQSLAGAISGAGGFTKSGAGTVTLAASNSYTGATTVSTGTLALSGNGALASTGTVSLTGSTAVFDISGASGSRTIALLTGSSGSSLVLGANGLTVGNATNGSFSGQIIGSGVLTKAGAGVLTLSGSNSAWTGGAVVTAGTIALSGNANSAIGTGPVTFQGGVLSSNGAGGSDPGGGGYGFTNAFVVPAGQVGTLNLPFRGTVSGSLTGSGTFNVNVHGSRDDFTGNWSSFSGRINIGTMAGSGDFRIAAPIGLGSAAVNIVAGASMYQTYNPPSTGSLETVQAIGELSGSGALGGSPVGGRFVNWSVGGLNTSSIFAGKIVDSTGVARLTKVGSGTLTLSGSNGYTGSTTISAGVLRIGDGGTTGLLNASTAISVANAATLAFNRSDDYDGPFANVISGSGALRLAAGTLTLSASNSYRGGTWIDGGTLVVSHTYAVGTGTVTLGSGATLNLNNYAIGNVITNNGGTVLNATFFSGTTVASGNTTYDGIGGTITIGANAVTVLEGDIDAVVNVGANGRGTARGRIGKQVTIVSGGTFDIEDGATLASGSTFTFSNNGRINVNRSTLLTIDKAITGSGSLVKTGTGRLLLAGNHSYSGPTDVEQGALVVNGQLSGTGVLMVDVGAVLMGTGTFAGLTVIDGGHSPGNSPGSETFTNGLTYGLTSNLVWELVDNTVSGPGTAFDFLAVTAGNLSIANGAVLQLEFQNTGSVASRVDWTDSFWASSHDWTIIDFSGAGTSTGIFTLAGSPASWLDSKGLSLSSARGTDAQFSVNRVDGDVVLSYVIVPEPSTLIIAGIGIALAWVGTGKRRKGVYSFGKARLP